MRCFKVSLALAFSSSLLALQANADGVATDEDLVKSILEDSDTNKDGKMSKSELIEMVKNDNVGEDHVSEQNREEAIAHIEQEFEKSDVDGDGNLDESELLRMVQSYEALRNSRMDETAEELMRDGDKDGDSFMSKEELVALIISDFEKSGGDRRDVEHRDASLSFVESHFEVHDEDQDGKLSVHELNRHITDFEDSKRRLVALAPLVSASPSAGKKNEITDEELVASIQKDADEDGDGKVSRDELIKLLAKEYEGEDLIVVQNREEAMGHVESEFAQKDADGDGKLDKAELLEMVQSYEQMRASRIDETVESMFNDGDADKDGFLTLEELKQVIQSDFDGSDKHDKDVHHYESSKAFVDRYFGSHDANKDGKLSFREFKSHINDFEDSKRPGVEL